MEEDRLVGGEKIPRGNHQTTGSEGENALFIYSFLVEFTQYLKEAFASIRTLTDQSLDKFEEKEFGKSFHGSISEEIAKIDSVLNGLLTYIRINRPMTKTNTVHAILEETLVPYQRQFEEKKITILKRFEKDLPETVIQDEELKYVIHSVLQYALLSTSPGGTIGLLTRSTEAEKETEDSREKRHVEILVVFTGQKISRPPPAIQKEKAGDLILILLKELVRKCGGEITCETDQKQSKRFISLKFQAERRTRVYFSSIEADHL